jgi:hypothetical protein
MPKSKGGRKMLDVAQRNQAIEIMWLKKYLNFDKDRPQWALVVDETMKLRILVTERRIPKEVHMNIFLQTWKTHTHATRDCHGLLWGFSRQPAPVPMETHAHSQRCGFLWVWVMG